MRAPLSWITEYCDPGLSLAELERAFTVPGTKVEAISEHGVRTPEHVVIGRVLTCEQHPDADRLRVTTVDIGSGEAATIVCGAPNVAAGQTVVVATPGTVMPNGIKIGRAKLRGVVSEGMICSEAELGISAEADGILALDDETIAPGTPALSVLPIADTVIEFEITPNRPDCLGVYGLARELHAATGAPLAPPPWEGTTAERDVAEGNSQGHVISIEIACPELCPRFTARVFEDVTVAPSPLWLRARLTAAGMRPINNVVDITNYVMLACGHPCHAFDLDHVAGERLVVRRALNGEQVQTLDGQTRTLDSEMAVIDDDDGPTSIAGVMGGARSEVQEGTTRVLFEAASWIGPNIHRTASQLALWSEASTRFAKGLAPEQALQAQELGTRLMLELTGARFAGKAVDAGPFAGSEQPAPVIHLAAAAAERLLGLAVEPAEQRARLTALGFTVTDAGDGDGFEITVPSFRRGDVTRPADLIEEIGRFHLDELPATLPRRRGAAGRLSAHQQARRRALDALIDRGAHEIVGWSFTSPDVADRLRLAPDSPGRRFVELENPMAAEHRVLRTSLLGSLLDAAAHNTARGSTDLTLVEQGAVYLARPGEALPTEHRALGLLQAGRVRPAGWGAGAEPPRAGFFTAKALLEAVLGVLRVQSQVEPIEEPFLHPGRAARVLAGGQVLGWLGEIHPLVAAEWELDGPVAAFELDLDRVGELAVQVPGYEHVPSHPPLREDLAVVVPDEVAAEHVRRAIIAAGGDLLARAELFDVYQGPQVGAGRRSLAFALRFQAPDRTLTADELAPLREQIIEAVREAGGELRS